MKTRGCLLASVLFLVVACANPPQTPQPTQAVDWDALARSVTKQYTARWLSGEAIVGSNDIWMSISTTRTIAPTDTDRFCSSINVQGAGNAIGKVVAAGLAEIAAVRKRINPEALEQMISLVADVTIATCSGWLPGLKDAFEPQPTPSLIPDWPPAGFSQAPFSADYAARYPVIQLACSDGTVCWDVEIISRRPCINGMLAMADALDQNGATVDSVSDYRPASSSGEPYRLHFETTIMTASRGPVRANLCL